MVTYLVDMKEGADADTFIADIKNSASKLQRRGSERRRFDFMSGSSSTQVIVDVTGDNPDAIAKGAEQVMAAIKPIKDVIKVKSNQEEKKPVYTFELTQ